ncbi:tyrosine-type recombinase/integrase [Patescibacteria group bacterium]|nr:tyrosine-type recombinase/integrase [Patescibacteria group bacterium]
MLSFIILISWINSYSQALTNSPSLYISLPKARHLRWIHFHDARHTHASLKSKQGVYLKVIQEMLGHSSIHIILDTSYSHVTPGLLEAAAKRFDELLTIANQL